MQMTFEEAYNQYLKYVDIKQKNQSKRSIEDIFKNHILVKFKDFNIYDFKTNDYIEFQYNLLKKNYKYSYLKKIHYTFSGFLEYCVYFLGLRCNICKIVGCFKKNINSQIEHNIYTLRQFKKFLRHCDTLRKKFCFLFLYKYGPRPGEHMALRFSDNKGFIIRINHNIEEHINKETGKRELTTPKTTSSYRTIRIDIFTKIYLIRLEKYYQKKYNDYDYDYFIFGGKEPLAPTTLRRWIHEISEKAKLPYIKPHEFRHSNASFLYNKKIPLDIISKRLGHSNVSTTLNTYIHSYKGQEKRVTRTLIFSRLF